MTTDTITRDNDHRSSADIQSDIRETRGRMDATLDELGNRLTARSLVNSALDWWDGSNSASHGNAASKKAFKAVARQVKHHPMPSLLIGTGVAWLISESMDHDEVEVYRRVDRSSSGVDPYGETYPVDDGSPGAVERAREATAGAMDAARDKASEVGDRLHRVADRVGDAAHSTYDRSRQAAGKLRHDLESGYHSSAERFERAVDEYPLAVGVAFAALGALAGLVIPRTRREDELMGGRSDALVDNVKEKGEELVETGKAVGHRVMDTVKEEVAEQGITADKVAATLSQMAEKGAAIVNKAKEEVTHAAEDEGIVPKERNPVVADEFGQDRM